MGRPLFTTIPGTLLMGLFLVSASGWGADFMEINVLPTPKATSSSGSPSAASKTASRPAPEKSTAVPTQTPVLGLTPGLPTPVPTASSVPNTTATPTPTGTPVSSDFATPVTSQSPTPVLVPTPNIVKGELKMKDFYAVGMKAYKAKDYEKSIRFLKQALDFHDPYTPKYYYAESNAMLGVIYQFFFKVPGHAALARDYYKAALKIDPTTQSAKLHLKEVQDGRDK